MESLLFLDQEVMYGTLSDAQRRISENKRHF